MKRLSLCSSLILHDSYLILSIFFKGVTFRSEEGGSSARSLLFDWIEDTAEDVGDTVGDTADGIGGFFGNLFDSIGDFFESIGDAIGDFWDDLF